MPVSIDNKGGIIAISKGAGQRIEVTNNFFIDQLVRFKWREVTFALANQFRRMFSEIDNSSRF